MISKKENETLELREEKRPPQLEMESKGQKERNKLMVGRMISHLDKAKLQIDSLLKQKRPNLTNETQKTDKVVILNNELNKLEGLIDQKNNEIKQLEDDIKELKETKGCIPTKTNPKIYWKPFKHNQMTLNVLNN